LFPWARNFTLNG